MYGENECNFRQGIKSKMYITEQDIEDAIGYRSPCVSLQQYNGTTSPAQGRSVREFEEQMASLRKENFNLKLRIYFIEESIPGYNQSNNTEGQETLMKQLIDSKVEMEILRKEIHEKQDLLKEAAQALNQMEQIQKDTEAKSQAIIDDLNHRIQYLEIENKEMEKSQSGKLMDELLGRSDVSSNINAVQKIRELEGAVKQSEEKINDFQDQIHKLDEILIERDQTIREFEDKVKELVFQNSELLEQLENKEKEVVVAERTIRGMRQNNKDLIDENHMIAGNLANIRSKYFRDMTSLKIYENTIKCQQKTIAGMHVSLSIPCGVWVVLAILLISFQLHIFCQHILKSALATKTKNMAKLLEYIQDYKKELTKLNDEKLFTQRENRFFKAIIEKLEKNEIQCVEDGEKNLSIAAKFFPKLLPKPYEKEANVDVDYRAVYEFKEKLCFNLSSNNGIHQTNSNSSLFCMAGSSQSIASGFVDNRWHSKKCQVLNNHMVKETKITSRGVRYVCENKRNL